MGFLLMKLKFISTNLKEIHFCLEPPPSNLSTSKSN